MSMNLLEILKDIFSMTNTIKESRRTLIIFHTRETNSYLKLIERAKSCELDKDTHDYLNNTIGHYLTNHLPEFIRETEPFKLKQIEVLKSKRDELIKEYNNWFYQK